MILVIYDVKQSDVDKFNYSTQSINQSLFSIRYRSLQD